MLNILHVHRHPRCMARKAPLLCILALTQYCKLQRADARTSHYSSILHKPGTRSPSTSARFAVWFALMHVVRYRWMHAGLMLSMLATDLQRILGHDRRHSVQHLVSAAMKVTFTMDERKPQPVAPPEHASLRCSWMFTRAAKRRGHVSPHCPDGLVESCLSD